MKLKEKLAYEFSTDRTSYIAGFEKARQMAIDLAMEWNKQDFDKLKGTTSTHSHFPIHKILFTSELKQLGEDEVI